MKILDTFLFLSINSFDIIKIIAKFALIFNRFFKGHMSSLLT